MGRESYIERRGVLQWYVVFPADREGGLSTELGPCMTRVGARISRWFAAL